MPLTRRHLLTALAGLSLLPATGPARGGGLFLRLAHPFPRGFPIHERLVQLAVDLREGGEYLLEIEVLPLGEAGRPHEYITYLYKDVLQFALVPTWGLGSLEVALERIGEFGLFPSFDHWEQFAAEEQDSRIARAFRQWDLEFFGSVWIGPSHLYSAEPVRRLEDLRGLRIKTARADARLMESLGGEPVNLPLSEVFIAMQTGVIDGTVVTLPSEAGLVPIDAGFTSMLRTPLGGTVAWMVGSPKLRYQMGDRGLDNVHKVMRHALRVLGQENTEASRNILDQARTEGREVTDLSDEERFEAFNLFRDGLLSESNADPEIIEELIHYSL